MRLKTRLLAGTMATGLVALAGLWQLQKSRSYQLLGELVQRVETREKVIALTYDDGPVHHEELLPMLASAGAKATFFVTGQGLEAAMPLARRMVEEGHELGNHSYSHRRMIVKPLSFIADEIDRTDRLIREAGHQGPIHFRPPYGKKLLLLPYYLAKTGRTTIMWDIEPEFPPISANTVEGVTATVLAQARPGGIIILHGRHWHSRWATPRILDGLQQRGYRFVTVSELLAVGREGASNSARVVP